MTSIRLGTRNSARALWHARQFQSRLAPLGVAVELVPLETLADKDTGHAIEELPSAAPFADALERELLAGRIDIALHRLKDVSLAPLDGLELVAVLARQDAREALLTRRDDSRPHLPTGSRVGVDSVARSAQLRHLRPDLTPVAMRGRLEARRSAVLSGEVDAAVVAAAGTESLDPSEVLITHLSFADLLPAPAQGALVCQIRADHTALRDLLKPFDHAPTRGATTAERLFQQTFQHRGDLAVAAYATATDRITLDVRLARRDHERIWSQRVRAASPEAAAKDAIDAAADAVGLIKGVSV